MVEQQPIGTNLALYQFLWMLLRGALHSSRGAIFPALQTLGLSDSEIRRTWAGLRYGAWDITSLLASWQTYVETQAHWQAYQYAGYYVKAVDLSAYWRPATRQVQSKHYDSRAGKALPAVVFGLVGRVGHIQGQRMALLDTVLREDLQATSEHRFQTQLLQRVAAQLGPDEMPVFDAGFKLKALQAAALPRFVVRLAKNFTARRNTLPESHGGRPPEYGERVRPLPRTYKGCTIAATPPDEVLTWQYQDLELRAELWHDLVRPDCKPDPTNATFSVAAIYDPRFEEPWLLACPLKLSGPEFWCFYRARWPIEQAPLAAKQMVGAHRQFVFAEESCYRLPELSLLAGSIQTYLAATFPPLPTGFWDHAPKRTPGRLRRYLARIPFSDLPPLASQRIRRKAAITAHLPKGIQAHRRTKSTFST